MHRLLIFFSVFLFVQCAVDRTINSLSDDDIINLEAFQNLDISHRDIIADDTEPGEQLQVCATFVNRESKTALANQKISFYHASTEGEYEPTDPNDDSTARLNGSAITDAQGRVYFETILPGDYGSSENNRHIHTTVERPQPKYYDIFFDQYSGGFGKFMNSQNNQMFFTTLYRNQAGLLVCFVTIEVKE